MLFSWILFYGILNKSPHIWWLVNSVYLNIVAYLSNRIPLICPEMHHSNLFRTEFEPGLWKSCAYFGDLEGCRVYRGFIEKLPTKRIQFGPCFAICSNGGENIYENVETEVEDQNFISQRVWLYNKQKHPEEVTTLKAFNVSKEK